MFKKIRSDGGLILVEHGGRAGLWQWHKLSVCSVVGLSLSTTEKKARHMALSKWWKCSTVWLHGFICQTPASLVQLKPEATAHAFNPSSRETEAGNLGLKTLSQNKNSNNDAKIIFKKGKVEKKMVWHIRSFQLKLMCSFLQLLEIQCGRNREVNSFLKDWSKMYSFITCKQGVHLKLEMRV